MTDTSLYTNLITSQHADKPKFVATVSLSAAPYVDLQTTLAGMIAGFDIDAAVGAQLDIVGQWVGISRQLPEPLANVYFTLDDPNLGLDQGYLIGPFDPTSGVVALGDDTYRVLLKAKIAANQWDGTTPGAYTAYSELFDYLGGVVLIQDNQDMTLGLVLLDANPDAVTKALFTGGYLSLKPEGVGITSYTITTGPIFGLDIENSNISGLDVGKLIDSF